MIALPFWGEFGWEVMLWAPHLRWLKQTMNYADMVVHCARGHSYLYRDFATRIVEHDPPSGLVRDCGHAWLNGARLTQAALCELIKFKGRKKDLIGFDSVQEQWLDGVPQSARVKHRSLGIRSVDFSAPPIVLHARSCIDKQPERNWPPVNFDRLVHLLLGHDLLRGITVATIGSTMPMDSAAIVGAVDHRGQSLEEVCNLMASARMVVGPSSGPLPLANLCGTPCVWWSANEKDQVRFASAWNPFRIPNSFVGATWQPDVDSVFKAVSELLSR